MSPSAFAISATAAASAASLIFILKLGIARCLVNEGLNMLERHRELASSEKTSNGQQ